MKKRRVLGTIILVSCMAGLASCGSSDGGSNGASGQDPDDPDPDTSSPEPDGGASPGDPDPDPDPDGGASPGDPDPEVPGPDDDRTNATALFRTADCGTLAVAATTFSNDSALPAVFGEGEIVSGRIDPGSAANTTHYWNIDLQAGFYHVVVDSTRIEERRSNIGLNLFDRDLQGSGRTILRGNEIDYRTRVHAFVEIASDRTLRLQLEPAHDAEDYLLGVFPNGTNVPSPYFEECPTILPVSLDETVAVDLEVGTALEAANAWYFLELPAGDYRLTSSAQRQDGDSGNIIYEFLTSDQLGQASRTTSVSLVNVIGSSADGSGAISTTLPGEVWIRVRNGNDALAIQFTLQEDS